MTFVTLLLSIYLSAAYICTVLYRLSPFHPLAKYPGPRLWWISSIKLVLVSWTGRRHYILDELHAKYGPYVRTGTSVSVPQVTVWYAHVTILKVQIRCLSIHFRRTHFIAPSSTWTRLMRTARLDTSQRRRFSSSQSQRSFTVTASVSGQTHSQVLGTCGYCRLLLREY